MIKAVKLHKQYGEKTALNSLDLEINSGEIFCLLGANGAGKTTTINLFLGFLKATSGEAYINSVSVTEFPLETKKDLAYIPENLILYPNLTALENIEYFSGLAGKSYNRNNLEAFLIEATLEKNAFNKQVKHYSKGMRQKVGIAIAIAKEAKALFLDEPTSGLDPKASNEFSNLLKRLSSNGTSILMASHDIFRVKEVGTHVGIMRDGNLVENLTTDDINHRDLESIYINHMSYLITKNSQKSSI